MKSLIKNFIIITAVLFLIAGAVSMSEIKKEEPDVIGIGALVQEINNEEVKSIEVKGDILVVNLNNEEAKTQEVKKEYGQSFSEMIDNYDVAPEKLQNYLTYHQRLPTNC